MLLYYFALKLYIGLILFTTSTVSAISDSISSADLYAIGDSSIVDSHTDVEYMPCIC